MEDSNLAGSAGLETFAAATIEAAIIKKINLAAFLNSVPVLQDLSIVNNSNVEIKDLDLAVYSIPPFLTPKLWRVESLGALQAFRIPNLDIQLDGTLLNRLTEAEKAQVVFVLRGRGPDGIEMARQEVIVELLPKNQWGGLGQVPDMVAAFVQPNEPAVERLLKIAAEVLRRHGKRAALDGYSGGPQRVWEVASAIWTAVAGMGLDYALPPANFEHTGQKVRGPGQIAESGLATCLDLALLFCSALEQAGLNSLVVFTKGHAFAGVWLKPEEFSTSIVDDVTALRKRVKLKQLIVFETTVITERPAASFTRTIELGAQLISEAKDESFELAVDIRRSRMQRIKPLAGAQVLAIAVPFEQEAIPEPSFDPAPELPEDGGTASDGSDSPRTHDRLQRWQRKLLDLSLRNSLLNLKSGKKVLKLEAPDPGSLEDILADGHGLKILSMPDLMEGTDPRNQAIHEGREHENVRLGHAMDALKRREVFVSVAPAELDERLVDLYRTSRASLQEGGANTLFLAIGFLSWTREERGGPRYRAPLILVPVSLTRRSIRSGFILTTHDDEPRFNPTLIEMLYQDFKLNLGVENGELPKDEKGLDVAAIWKAVSLAVKDIKGWEVIEEVVLSIFSFSKYLMWKDLTERTDELRENPVVRHLLDTPRDNYSSSTTFPDPKRLDVEYHPEQIFCPLLADSSQLAAIMAGARGNDFVLIGPPGTGKSQTISNLIAQCIAEGKTVLFVSEKMAALDVVYRRLREVGLGEFCLELHSNKASKSDVLAQLQQSWEAQGDIDPEVWKAEAQRLKKLRDHLNIYVTRLHFQYANGMTIYGAIGIVSAGEDISPIGLSWNSPDAHTAEFMEGMREVVDRVDVNVKALGISLLLSSPLAMISNGDWTAVWQQSLIGAARQMLKTAESVQGAYSRFAEAAGLPANRLNGRARAAMGELARSLPKAAGRDWRFVLRSDARAVCKQLHEAVSLLRRHRNLTDELSADWPDVAVGKCRRGLQLLAHHGEIVSQLSSPWPEELSAEMKKGLGLLAEVDDTTRQLSVPYTDQIEQHNVVQLQREWIKAEKAVWPFSLLGKRKIRLILTPLVASEDEPDFGQDLQALTKLRKLRSEIAAVELGMVTDGIWAGLKTRRELALCALRFQDALRAARSRQPWMDSGFESIESGLCGERLSRQLEQLRALAAIDFEIQTLELIEPGATGLWMGHATRIHALEAALGFQLDLRSLRTFGSPNLEHVVVACGECGAAMAADLKCLRDRSVVELELTSFSNLKEITSGLWDGLTTNVDQVGEARDFYESLSRAIAILSATPEAAAEIRTPLEFLLGDGNSLLDCTGRIAESADAYLAAWPALQAAIGRMEATSGELAESKTTWGDSPLDELLDRAGRLIESERALRAWCAWRKVRGQAMALELEPLVTGIENGVVVPGTVRRAFEIDYSRWWLNAVVDADDVIRTFVSAEHEKRIEDFRAIDDRFAELTKALVRANLSSRIPAQDGPSKSSEWGLLRHEISKKKRQMPLRELIANIPAALTTLAPCLLMSPISIAQYLVAKSTRFDVVVFDEASQIPIWDALGAIARGKQVVMVGDPKQLPPTSFFDRAESDPDDENVEGDLESVLDECISANLPVVHLAWHYRSRSESLIAFSNHRYYGGSLVTFPSPNTEDLAVSYHHTAGIYEKGRARINKSEAKALVADLVGRLKSPGFKNSGLTIGVVTFNSEQQSLIEDLLDEQRRRDPSIEQFFAEVQLEPVFVKNIESVQGDERDIMYFSITYGPDLTGAVSMNFGPMNRQGGERRLNVAITRARHELRVFSSLRAEQMDLARTQAIGVRDLKHFLEFAERGSRALAEAKSASLGDFESPFEEAVAENLKRKGWQVHTQIGASSFRVDLAIVDPDAAGAYLAGIECDGATYHRSATARDRDKLREGVLRGLGWEILRIWSTDWWIDRVGALEKVDAKLKDLLVQSRLKRTAKLTAADRLVARGNPSVALDETGERTATKDEPQYIQLAPPPNTPDTKADFARNAHSALGLRRNVLIEADLASAMDRIDVDAFFDASYDAELRKMISHIVEVEGPVMDSVVALRVARAHNWQRTGSRIRERINSLASNMFKKTEEDVGVFYWADERGPDTVLEYRQCANGSARSVQEICMEELIALARKITDSGQKGEAGLIAMAREIGLSRLQGASRVRLERAFREIEL